MEKKKICATFGFNFFSRAFNNGFFFQSLFLDPSAPFFFVATNTYQFFSETTMEKNIKTKQPSRRGQLKEKTNRGLKKVFFFFCKSLPPGPQFLYFAHPSKTSLVFLLKKKNAAHKNFKIRLKNFHFLKKK